MKTLLATAALAIAGPVTVQAAEIFTCSGLGYAIHNGKIERACTAPVTTHWQSSVSTSPPWSTTSRSLTAST
jgi:hypothetical protein